MAKKRNIVEKVIAFEGEQDFILNANKPDFISAGEVLYVEAVGSTTQRSATQTLTGVQDQFAPVTTTQSPTAATQPAPTTGLSTPIATTTPTPTATTQPAPTRTEVAIPTKPIEPRVVTEIPVPTKPTEPRVVTEVSFCFYEIDKFTVDVSGNQAAVSVTTKKITDTLQARLSGTWNGKIAYSLDGSAPIVTDASFVLKNLSAGSHTLTVSAVCDTLNGVDISTAKQTKTFTVQPSTTTVTTTTTLVPPFRGGFGGGGGGGAAADEPVAPVKKKQFPFLLLILIAGGIYLFAKDKKD